MFTSSSTKLVGSRLRPGGKNDPWRRAAKSCQYKQAKPRPARAALTNGRGRRRSLCAGNRVRDGHGTLEVFGLYPGQARRLAGTSLERVRRPDDAVQLVVLDEVLRQTLHGFLESLVESQELDGHRVVANVREAAVDAGALRGKNQKLRKKVPPPVKRNTHQFRRVSGQVLGDDRVVDVVEVTRASKVADPSPVLLRDLTEGTPQVGRSIGRTTRSRRRAGWRTTRSRRRTRRRRHRATTNERTVSGSEPTRGIEKNALRAAHVQTQKRTGKDSGGVQTKHSEGRDLEGTVLQRTRRETKD
ncbi:hypothetical protein C8R47DRAFT_1071860 [Mycena vitilis]|nr:hypothetical protein C8R47DRAFT_1071860 [Mycena vitilis]